MNWFKQLFKKKGPYCQCGHAECFHARPNGLCMKTFCICDHYVDRETNEKHDQTA